MGDGSKFARREMLAVMAQGAVVAGAGGVISARGAEPGSKAQNLSDVVEATPEAINASFASFAEAGYTPRQIAAGIFGRGGQKVVIWYASLG